MTGKIYIASMNMRGKWAEQSIENSIKITKKWWKQLKEPKRRYPNSKGKKVLYALFDGNDEKMDYITSRKKVYVPEYYELIKDKDIILYWRKKLNEGYNLIVYDFDGPRTKEGNTICLELTKELLIEKINDTLFPFGHGYIVGACIAGIYWKNQESNKCCFIEHLR